MLGMTSFINLDKKGTPRVIDREVRTPMVIDKQLDFIQCIAVAWKRGARGADPP